MKRFKAIAVFCFVVVFILAFALTSGADKSVPVIYKNDTKYNIEEYPAEIIDGKIYLPISFFVGFDNLQYVPGRNPAGFYLRNEKTDRYLSFSSNAQYIVADGTLTEISFPIKNSTVYMPLDYCAEVLSLEIEKLNDEKMQRIRVCDGSQKLTFKELIDLYNSLDNPDDPSVIVPDNPNDTPIAPLPDRTLFITIDRCDESLSLVLDVLEKRNIKATLFLDEDGIISYPETVIRAFIAGHSLGVAADSEEGIEKANDALCSLLKFKTRLCRLNGKSTGSLENKGYINWSFDIDADTIEKSAITTARDIYNKTFETNEMVVRFTPSQKTADVIERILYYMSGDEYITTRTIDNTTSKS